MDDKTNGYYDIALSQDRDVDSLFYIKDLKQRKLFLSFEISQETIWELVRHILQYNREDAGIDPKDRKPILLYIASPGGESDSGFELIDVIQSSQTPVYTINLGYEYSMAFLIGLAGHKRYALKNAKYLMHDGTYCAQNSFAKAKDQMEFQRKMEEREKEYVIANSKLSSDEFENKYRTEWYLFASEAKEKGFVDYIIGEDCDIGEII